MTGVQRESALAGLRRIISERPAPAVGERCEMCAEPISDDHPHVVDLESRALMCTCRGCYLLFTAEDAQLRYRAVPDRYLSFPDFTLDATSGSSSVQLKGVTVDGVTEKGRASGTVGGGGPTVRLASRSGQIHVGH